MKYEGPSRVLWPNVVLRIPVDLVNELETIASFNAVSPSRILTMACMRLTETARRSESPAPAVSGYGETEEEVLGAAEKEADE